MAVLGMGGLFFRADDPEALSAWYKKHLNVGAGCDATGAGANDPSVWQVNGGPMVFQPFERGPIISPPTRPSCSIFA